MSNLTAVLLACDNATDAIKSLLTYKKAMQSKYSNSYVCRKLGINYRSYLSDVLNRRKKLSRKYWHPFFKVMKLNELESEYLECLLQLENCSEKRENQRLLKRLHSVKKELSIPVVSGAHLRESSRDLYFSFEVYAAFGLFNCQPSHQNLIDTFGAANLDKINRALKILLKLDLIQNFSGIYHAKSATKYQRSDLKQLEELHLLAVDDAQKNTQKWIHNGEAAFFFNCTLSVHKEKYFKQLQLLKKQFRNIYSEMEVEDADSIVKILVQIYPYQ